MTTFPSGLPSDDSPQSIELAPANSALTDATLVPVEEMARRLLREGPYAVLRRVECAFENGVLKLTGVLPSFHMLQVALQLVKDIPGVQQLDNRIEVVA